MAKKVAWFLVRKMITLQKGDSVEQRNVEISNYDVGLRVWYMENRRQIVFRK